MKMMAGFVAGWLMSVPVYLYWATPPALELERELAAYRECMEQAPKCRMTAQDFVRYHELRHQLEETGK